MKKQSRNVLAVILLSVLMVTAFSSVTLAQPGESSSGSKIPPDMPVDALQLNKTNTTPTGEMESIQAMETKVFFYRNFTLMMNCTENCALNMTLDPQIRNRLLTISVEPNQTMTLTMNVSASPPQGEAVKEQTLNFYIGLETNATLQLQSQLRLHINQTELSAELGWEVNASRLTWMYWNQTQNQWTPVESYMNQDGYLVCNTDHFSTWTVGEYAPVNSGSKIPPDMPVDALQLNKTDTTPSGEMESIQAMETKVFFYRNFTLMMNCTENCALNMTLDPQVRNRLLTLSVEPNQTMTLAMNVSTSPPQGEAVMENNLNFYMGLEPNADLQLQSQLRLHINQTELSQELGRELNMSKLTWMYWNQTRNNWVPVESHMDQNGYLVCNTDHFSTWTVAEYDPEVVPENIHIYTVVGLVDIVSVASIYLKRKKR